MAEVIVRDYTDQEKIEFFSERHIPKDQRWQVWAMMEQDITEARNILLRKLYELQNDPTTHPGVAPVNGCCISQAGAAFGLRPKEIMAIIGC